MLGGFLLFLRKHRNSSALSSSATAAAEIVMPAIAPPLRVDLCCRFMAPGVVVALAAEILLNVELEVVVKLEELEVCVD